MFSFNLASPFRSFRIEGCIFPAVSFRFELNRKAEKTKNPIPYIPHPGSFSNEEKQAKRPAMPCRDSRHGMVSFLCIMTIVSSIW